MPTALYTTDVQKITDRTPKTTLVDTDVFVVANSSGTLAPITKVNAKKTLGIDDAETALTAVKGTGWTDENLVDHEDRITQNESDIANLEGAGRTTETVKGNADAIATLETTVDTNHLYSDSQYLALKAKADSLQVKCNTLQAEVYTDAPILQYGAVEIIGDGYEADGTPIDVSANVVDGSLDIEQKGLTITNLVSNGDFSQGTTGWTGVGSTLTESENVLTATGNGASSLIISYNSGASNIKASVGDKIFVIAKVKIPSGEIGAYFQGFNGVVTTESLGSNFSVITDSYAIYMKIATLGYAYSNFKVGVRVNFIDSATANGKVIEVDGNYGVSAYNLTALGLDSITDTDILAKLLPYVDGTKSVGKMGIQILDADDNVTQTIFLPEVGNRVPNGTADSIKTVADGWEHTKRVERYVLQASDITTFDKGSFTNLDVAITSASLWTALGAKNTTWVTGVVSNQLYCTTYPEVAFSDNISNINRSYVSGGDYIGFALPKLTYANLAAAQAALAGTVIYYQLATPITTHYDLPHLTSGKTIHRFAGEEKIALYGTGLTFSENVLSVLSAVKFVAGVMTDITDLATITDDTVTFSGVNATDVVYVKVEHDVDKPLGVLEHTPTVSNTASRLEELEGAYEIIEDAGVQYIQFN